MGGEEAAGAGVRKKWLVVSGQWTVKSNEAEAEKGKMVKGSATAGAKKGGGGRIFVAMRFCECL